LSGCHDTTLAAVLASLGAFQGEPWPPYTSHIALELFKASRANKSQDPSKDTMDPVDTASPTSKASTGWFSNIFGSTAKANDSSTVGIARTKLEKLKDSDKAKLDGYFVRIRYNDKVMNIPGCQPIGKHFEGDESFCTLVIS
jgi:acid phosphatase